MTKPMPLQELRRAEAARLTALLEGYPTFSFIRLGDGEVKWLRKIHNADLEAGYRSAYEAAQSVEVVGAVVGLEVRHYPRFVSALEQASYLDRCDSIPQVRRYLQDTRLKRAPSLYMNRTPQTSNIIFEWTWFELHEYLKRHRCLFAAAEAALLRELCCDPDYQKIASQLLPLPGTYRFHQIREDGRRYSENLDLIKHDLRREIEEHHIDTVFLSLSTGAKIIAHELSHEAGVRVVDFGSMVRALTYAGAPGYQAARDMHNPFLFRIPIATFSSAMERAHPQMSIAEITARAHAQLVLELQHHKRFAFNTSHGLHGGSLDLTEENLRNFDKGLAYYNRHIRHRSRADTEGRKLDADFRRWCLKQGLGWRGRVFSCLVAAKAMARIPKQYFSVRYGHHPLTLGRIIYLAREKFGSGFITVWYRDVVRQRILEARPLLETTDDSCEIHVLTSQDDWLNLLWALRSFYHASGARYALCIHDDGTLDPNAFERLQSAFPNARIIPRQESDRKLTHLLVSYPRCQEFRATSKLALKILDFVAFLQSDRMLLMDSDILFFHCPSVLLDTIGDGSFRRNTLNRDWADGYSIDPDTSPPDFHLPRKINSGLGLIHQASIRYDWIEEFLALPSILDRPHCAEQTLFALCSARYGFKMLPREYDVHLGEGKHGIPCRHYTGPVRHLMYSEGLRRLVRSGFLRSLGRT